MKDKIIDLSEEPASLRVHYDQLILESGGKEHSVPLEELAVLIVAHPAVCYTHAVLKGICASGGALVICDEKKMPTGLLLPYTGHFVQTERFAAQIKASQPTKKSLWCQLVKSKIENQGLLLRQVQEGDFGLLAMAKKVRPGDPANLEARASRRYWPALFGDDFNRRPQARDNLNNLLNYGYAVLRSLVSRSLCASGLHPSIGIHHHSRYNPFCLADDMMEPYRPAVDEAVLSVINFLGADAPLDKSSKGVLLSELKSMRLLINKKSRCLFDAVNKTASSLCDVYLGKRRKLILPQLHNE